MSGFVYLEIRSARNSHFHDLPVPGVGYSTTFRFKNHLFSADSILLMAYAVISFLRSLARYGSLGLSPASGFEHPASTLSTRFPTALGIGHGLPAA